MKINNTEIEVIQADITQVKIEAIVHDANNKLVSVTTWGPDGNLESITYFEQYIDDNGDEQDRVTSVYSYSKDGDLNYIQTFAYDANDKLAQ